jgi:2-oxo-3-hexenedioate decarboxylase
MTASLLDSIASDAFRILGTGAQVESFSARHPGFSLADAYCVTARVRRMREARGERAVGRKIGFTNRTIWDEYDVHAPIWGYVYDRTLFELRDLSGEFPLEGFAEPRIEPEVVFGLARAPEPGMDDAALLACAAWVAPGFEIVQSIFPGWRFSPADTVAAFGLHGALLLGPRLRLEGADRAALARELSSFTIELSRDGAVVDRGAAANVLDGPLAALRHLVEALAADPASPGLAPGEIVTTGTLTRAFPVAPGETWSTALKGVPLAGIAVRFV